MADNIEYELVLLAIATPHDHVHLYRMVQRASMQTPMGIVKRRQTHA